MTERDEPTLPDQHSYPAGEDESETPDRIGPYRILQVMGEGGMGIVYDAEQTEPINRRVALKVIRLGMDTKQVVARFEAERQALAVMDHQCIARVYDAGATESGRPYFAMERVSGVPLGEYCDNNGLTTMQRLELFVDLCRGVQHAHQKGVIHRDLKPSNILVTEQDGKAIPKVIDFGIAKAVGRSLTDRTLVTSFGEAMGTPAYMSPEQAEMSGLDVDTRTDVYSLGVVLYELLVGVLPIDPKEMGLPGFIAQLVLRETNPPTPSSRVSSLGAKKDFVAKQRHTDANALQRQLRGDIDWITMKALDPDRSKRYETVNGLATDIELYLRDEPVSARRPSARYRAMKFASRHKVGVAGAVVLVLILAGSSVTMTLSRNRAVRAEARARMEMAKSTAINDFLQRMLSSANPWVGGRDVRVADVLDQSAEEIDSVFGDQPEVRAAVELTVGRTYRGLGIYDAAESHLMDAVNLRREILPEGNPDIAESVNDLGVLRFQMGDFAAADSLLREALAIRMEAFGEENLEVAESMHNLAAVKTQLGDYAAADSLYSTSLNTREALLGEEDLLVAESMSGLATLLFTTGEYAEAESLLRSALEMRRNIQGEHLDVAMVANDLAMTLRVLERYDEAEPLYHEAVRINRSLLGDEHPAVAQSINNLAVFLWRKGELQEAERLLREALAMNRELLGDDHPDVGSNLNNLALILRDQGNLAESERLFRQVLAIDRNTIGDSHPEIARRLNSLGATLTLARKFGEAERVFREALRIQIENFGADTWQAATAKSLLGDCLIKSGRFADAEPLVVEAFEIIRAEFGDQHGRTRAALSRVIAVYEGLGDAEKVAQYGAMQST